MNIAKVVAVSPELDPAETLRAIERGRPFYHRYFMRKWAQSLLRKQAAWPSVYDFAGMLRLPSLRHMTEEMVRRFTLHGSLGEYLAGYSVTGDILASLQGALPESLHHTTTPSSRRAHWRVCRPCPIHHYRDSPWRALRLLSISCRGQRGSRVVSSPTLRPMSERQHNTVGDARTTAEARCADVQIHALRCRERRDVRAQVSERGLSYRAAAARTVGHRPTAEHDAFDRMH